MSLGDWIGVVLLAPLLVALGILLVYIAIGLLGSSARRRRVKGQRAQEVAAKTEVARKRPVRQVPGD